MPKIFSSFLFGLNVISKKKKKKGHHADKGIFFFDFMLISKKKKKKKVLRLISATFLRDFCDIPERGAVNLGCLRFLARNKTAGFWREKKRRNSQNFSAKMPEKILHFFALIGNTAVHSKGVVKYKPSVLFQNLCDSCMSVLLLLSVCTHLG